MKVWFIITLWRHYGWIWFRRNYFKNSQLILQEILSKFRSMREFLWLCNVEITLLFSSSEYKYSWIGIQNKNLRGSLQAKNGFRQRGDYWSLLDLNWIFSMVNLMTRQVFYRVPNWVEMWQNWISQSCILWPGDDYDDDKWSRWRRKRSDVLIFYKNVRTDSLWLIFAKIISTFLLVVHHQHPHW